MACILQFDTTEGITSVSLSNNGKTISCEEEEITNTQAQIITILIKKVLSNSEKTLKDIHAVGLSKGPGSYTGLRIGSSTAKGICFGLKIPLIAIDTLEVMNSGLRNSENNQENVEYYCPMIDARRMEVFMAIFSPNGDTIRKSSAAILDGPFVEEILNSKTLFFGSGAEKIYAKYADHPKAYFKLNFKNSSSYLSPLCEKAFLEGRFENLVDFEPYYLKEFYTSSGIH